MVDRASLRLGVGGALAGWFVTMLYVDPGHDAVDRAADGASRTIYQAHNCGRRTTVSVPCPSAVVAEADAAAQRARAMFASEVDELVRRVALRAAEVPPPKRKPLDCYLFTDAARRPPAGCD